MKAGQNTQSFWEMDELRIITGAMVILAGATALMVAVPYLLLKDIAPPAGLKPYTASQAAGRQVYIANGCVYCHSQQPRDIKQAPDAARAGGGLRWPQTTPTTPRTCWAPCGLGRICSTLARANPAKTGTWGICTSHAPTRPAPSCRPTSIFLPFARAQLAGRNRDHATACDCQAGRSGDCQA